MTSPCTRDLRPCLIWTAHLMARCKSNMDTAHENIVLALYTLLLHRILYYVTQRQPRPYLGYF